MPTGSDPPPVQLNQTVFNALHALTYNSNAKAFRDAQNNNIYMFVENYNGTARWFYGTNTEGGINPRGDIPQATADVILSGSYNSQLEVVTYGNQNYKVRLERDSNGLHIAKAYTV